MTLWKFTWSISFLRGSLSRGKVEFSNATVHNPSREFFTKLNKTRELYLDRVFGAIFSSFLRWRITKSHGFCYTRTPAQDIDP